MLITEKIMLYFYSILSFDTMDCVPNCCDNNIQCFRIFGTLEFWNNLEKPIGDVNLKYYLSICLLNN